MRATEYSTAVSDSLAAFRATYTGHGLGDVPAKRYPGPPYWGLGVGMNSNLVNTVLHPKPGNGKAMAKASQKKKIIIDEGRSAIPL